MEQLSFINTRSLSLEGRIKALSMIKQPENKISSDTSTRTIAETKSGTDVTASKPKYITQHCQKNMQFLFGFLFIYLKYSVSDCATALHVTQVWINPSTQRQIKQKKIETHKITAVVSPVCSRLLCQQRSSRTRWVHRPQGIGPCWRQSEDRSSHMLHPPLSPASYGWLPSLQKDIVEEDGEIRIKEPHANNEVESEVQL